MTDISSSVKREKLKQRREPYWRKIRTTSYLGFRRTANGGTWHVRTYDPSVPKQTYHSLGDLAGNSPEDQFDVAIQLATDWLTHVRSGGSTENITVLGACNFFLDLKNEEAEQLRDGARAAARTAVSEHATRLLRLVSHHRIADIPLTKLTKHDVTGWRNYLRLLPALVTRKKLVANETKTRSASTLNRDMVPLRAALNFALKHGHVLTDIAWRSALEPIKNADRRRELYLDRDQRQALIKQMPNHLATFARGLSLLPLRPGALAKLVVSNFDVRKHELHIPSDKAGGDRRILLPPSTSEFFATLCRLKLPGAPLFAQVDGKAWNKDSWKRPIKVAAKAAELPPEVTAYSLRHSTITDLVTGGLDLLTIAQISGTSAAMIEKHYGHLRKQHAADALAALAL